MVKILFNCLLGLWLIFVPCILNSQTTPNLGTATGFALFTSVGNLSNSGPGSTITGNVGTNLGTSSVGTPVSGSVHIANATTSQAATDVSNAYSFLSGQTCGSTLGTSLGGGQVLTPDVYCINGLSTLTGTLVLDGQGNPNSIFIIKITSGGLTVGSAARVVLTNSTSICNVFWQVNGPVNVGSNAIVRGTFLANGLINLDMDASLLGRGLSLGGNITTRKNTVTVSLPPVASVISASGSTTLCSGGNVILSGNNGGTWNTASSAPSITVTTSGTYFVTNTTSCGSVTSNSISVTVNPLPTVSVNSGSVCNGSAITLTATGASTYSWLPSSSLSAATGATVSASPTITTIYTVTGTSAVGCVKTATTSVNVIQNPTIAVSSVYLCAGASKTLSASGGVSYTWSPATGLSSTTGATVTASPDVTTSYTISGSSAAGCSNSTVATVSVVSNPTISVNSATICNGASTVLSTNGASSFSWSPSTGLSSTNSATVTANPTITTIYTVTGNSGGCAHTVTASVLVNALPDATVAVTGSTVFCQGNSATLTAAAASSYSWSTGETSQSIIVSATGNYSVTLTGANGCTVTSSGKAILVNPSPTVSVNSGSICNGSSIGLSANGANTYSWSPGSSLNNTTGPNVTANPTVTTVYTLTGTSNMTGCKSTVFSTITVVPLPTVAVNSASVCLGSSTVLTASGAGTYSWSPATGLSSTNSVSVTANPTLTTVYTVTGSVSGCTGSTTVNVTVNTLPTSSISVGGPVVFCEGDSVVLTASPASGFLWSTSATSQSIAVHQSGSYSVTVTDGNGCQKTSASVTVTVNPLPLISVNDGFVCSGGSATLTATGAASYSWSPSVGLSGTTGSVVISGPASSTQYTVTGLSSDGCSGVSTSSVTVAPAITLTINSASLCIGSSTTLTATGANSYSWSPSYGLNMTSGAEVVANPTVTTVYTITGTAGSCSEVSTATVTVNALPSVSVTAGGPTTFCEGDSVALTSSSAVSYLWSNGATTQSISVIAAGNYSVTVTDANGCQSTSTDIAIYLNPAPVASVTAGSSLEFCQGDSVILNSSVGTSYLWSTGATTQTISVLASGDYSVRVTGLNGCSATSAITTVTVHALPTASISTGGPLVFCQGDSLILTASSASNFLWSTAATSPSIAVHQSGNYSVTVTDGNGCQNTSAAVTVTVNPLPVVGVNDGFVCSGGSATLTATGASSYSWSPSFGLSSTTGSTVISSPASSTHYTVTGLSVDGCVGVATSSVTVAPAITLTINSASLCIGSSTTLTATGANSYSWSPAYGLNITSGAEVVANPTVTTVYTVTGTVGSCSEVSTVTVTVNPLPSVSVTIGGPITFCEGDSVSLTSSSAVSYLWSNGATTQSISVLDAGNYSVTVTDANGCQSTSTVVTVNLNPSPVLSVNDGYICNGWSALLIASGATSYTWSPAGTLSASTGMSVTANPTVNTNYTVTGTNAFGCGNSTTANVSIVPDVTLTVSSATICEGSSAVLTASGAMNYTWSPVTGLNAVSGVSVTANPTITTIYTVIGESGNCTVSVTATVQVNALPQPSISASGSLAFCEGGSVVLSTGPASTYTWSNGAQTPSISVTDAGNYSVQVTDANGCSNTSSIVAVVVHALPSSSVTVLGSTSICQGENVILTAEPGLGYLWSNSATTQSIMVSSSGSYSVKVTDGNGCSSNSSITNVTVNLTPSVVVNASGLTTFCQGKSITLTANPAEGYLWSTGATTQSIEVTSAGNYSVTITDGNGCQANSTVTTVSVNPSPVVDLGTDTTVCGCIMLTAFNPGASYSWSTGSDYSTINVCLPGTYWVNVSNGTCISTDTIHVVALSVPLVNISVASGSVNVLNAGNPGATYLWNTGATTQTIATSTSGKYYVTVTNQNGCSASDTLLLGMVGIQEQTKDYEQLKVYPNPMNGIFTIEVSEARQVEITNMLGETLKTTWLNEGKNNLSLSEHADGIYFVKIFYDHGYEIIKMVKEN